MITLTQANKDALERREIRISPLLEVANDTTLTNWTVIPASELISRPLRSSSPIVSRTPVVRLDFEVVANSANKAFFNDKRTIRYKEIVNGQTLDRFFGNVETPQKAFAIKDGAIVETLRVTAYSVSQKLADLEYERVKLATTNSIPSVDESVAMTYVLGIYTEWASRAGAGDDYLSSSCNHLFSPNALGPASKGRAKIWVPSTSTLYLGGTDFRVIINGFDFQVQWLVAGPAANTEYIFYSPYVVGFVVPEVDVFYNVFSASKATPAVYALKNEAWSLSYDTDPYREWGIGQIPTTSLAFYRRLSQTKSKPRVFIRKGTGTGAQTAELNNNWAFNWEMGYMYYNSPLGSSGTRYIFSDNQYHANDVMYVGVCELYWPSISAGNNKAEYEIDKIYDKIGINTDLEESEIVLGDFRIKDVKGDAALRELLSNCPPNYTIYDGPDGVVKSKYVVQSGTADFKLTQIKALRDRELPPTVYTGVRVLSLLSENVSPWHYDFYNNGNDWPEYDPADWTDYGHLWDKTNSTFATMVTNPSYITYSHRGNSNVIERCKSISVKFEGKLSVYRVISYVNPTDASPPGETLRNYLQPYSVYFAPSGSPKEITITIPEVSKYGEGGQHPERIILEFATYSGAATVKVWNASPTFDRYILASAFLTDESPNDGSWTQVLLDSLNPDNVNYDQMGIYKKRVPADVLKSWMLEYNSPNTVGNEKTFFFNWYKHRIFEITDNPGLSLQQALDLAKAYLEDTYRRATAKEVDVIYEAQAEIGDTIEIYNPTDSTTSLWTIVGFRDGGSLDEPFTTLEIANYAA